MKFFFSCIQNLNTTKTQHSLEKQTLPRIIQNLYKSRNKTRRLKLFAVVQQMPISVLIVDLDGNLEFANSMYTKMTGYTFEEANDLNQRGELLTNDLSNEVYENLASVISIGNIWSGEFQNRKKNMTHYWEFVIITPVKNEAKGITHFIIIKEDITQKKLKLEKLVTLKENANKLKSIFLAQMSHEIRTPINTLLGMTSLLRYNLDESSNINQLMTLEIMDRAGARIIRTFDLLMNLSEIQTNSYEISPTQFDLVDEIIIVVIAKYKNLAKKKNIKLSLDCVLLGTKLFADYYSVNQIFEQLVDNAMKFTEKGMVSIKVFCSEPESLAVIIKDTGIGIEESYLPHLFEVFSQEEMGYTRKFDGNGIGLALVKAYCNLNGAKIGVESCKGFGSTFQVTIKI